MSNSIPLNTGTLKERKERQAKADADLKLQIANSARLSRASRDYWINGEAPINTQPDYTTNEILNDKNKLLKVLANDVKSLLDKEQYAIFIADNTWNNVRYLQAVVQLFPAIKKEVLSRLRLVTARQLMYIINTFIDEEQQQADEQDPYDNQDGEQYDYGYNYNNRRQGDPIAEDPAERIQRGVQVVPYRRSDRQDDGQNDMELEKIYAPERAPDFYINEYGERIRRPNRPDNRLDNDPPPPYSSREDYQAELRRRNLKPPGNAPPPGLSTPQKEKEIYRNLDREGLNSPFDDGSSSSSRTVDRRRRAPMQRDVSDVSDLTSLDDLVPYEQTAQKTEPDEALLGNKITLIGQFNKIENVEQILSRLINVERPELSKNASTRLAKKKIVDEFMEYDRSNMSVAEQEALKLQIAKNLASNKVTSLYLDRSKNYDFPNAVRGSKKVYEKYGFGAKPKKGVKVGRGCTNMEGLQPVAKVDRSELYYSFGTFCIHKKSLGDNILNLKYKSFSQVHKFPKRQISADLRDILVDAIETKKINNKLFSALTDSDKHFLTELVNEAKLKDQFANIFKTKVGDGIAVNEPALERWEILRGELVSGNTNGEIKKEMRLLINQFMKEKLITAQEGFGILELL